MNKNEKGFTPVILIVVLAILIVGAGAVSYYLLKGAGKAPEAMNFLNKTVTTPLPISDSDELVDISDEFDMTEIESLEKDFKELESSITSL